MKLTIAKWGHSAALRIPRTILNQLSTEIGCELDVRLEGNRLVLEPTKPNLERLLSMITPENRHSELLATAKGAELL